MRPIGILTFHRASNYGAVLQAYALQQAFRKIGSDAVIVNYLNKVVEGDHRPVGLFTHHNPVSAALRYPIKAKKDRLFNEFRSRKLVMTEEVLPDELSSLKDSFSLFVTGSDQVWNDRFSGLDPAYMLTFAQEQQRYSYACSFGFEEFPEGKEDRYKELLSGMQCLSLREMSGKELVEKIGLEGRVDLDPTLLLDEEHWREFSKAPKVSGHYILVYTVNPDVHLVEFARKLSAETGCGIMYLNNQYKSNRDLTRVRYASPEEYVGWFANAQYVLTNSFHGTAFSIIFHRRFKVELETKKKYNVRSRDLLINCGLQNCILRNNSEDHFFNTEWEEADRLLDSGRELSRDYLKKIVERAGALQEEMSKE